MAGKIEQLLDTPPQALIEELDRIRERERKVARERELLERVLEILAETGGESANRLHDLADGILTVGPLRSQIVRVMQAESRKRIWLPRQVHEQLVGHGNKKASLDNVRATMRRMAASGELTQPSPSKARFSLPPKGTS
jgi:hypothetical protein